MTTLVFEKRDGKFSRLSRTRNGVTETIDAPNQAPMPHDMFHAAVERTIGARGFAHRFAAGEGSGFRMHAEARSESVERLVEAMQADSWSGRPDPAEVIALYHVTCAARGDAPLEVTVDDIVRIRSAIDALATMWAALPVGGRHVVELDD